MSRAMTMGELSELLKHIQQHHSFCQNTHGKHIKYVDPLIDTRNWNCYAIRFRGFSETFFHTQNECRDLPESLYDRVMNWLDQE